MRKTIYLSLFIALFISGSALAQTQVTFNIDMRYFMADTSFVPGRDFVEITGSFFPINSRPVRMQDTAPKDSIYTAEVTFPSRYNNMSLQYNYQIRMDGEDLKEDSPRIIPLTGKPIILPPLSFNAFAW